MPRYAMVVVVEADFLEIAWEGTASRLSEEIGEGMVFVGTPLEAPEADEYATAEIHLLCDDYRRVLRPETEEQPK